ncbi:MAG TPA: hypothetical protein VFT22_07105 [Kofleriaceae bacterium]|nr:hypothetical protein [Kofleriaceae bacterium]
MAHPQRSPKELQPPADFGRKALELAESVGKTKQDLLKATRYDSMKTLDRLIQGDGSVKFAAAVVQALRSWGADVSQLPRVEMGALPVEGTSEWVQEWADLGRQLYGMAPDEKLDFELERLRELVRAIKIVAEGTGGFAKRPK